MPLSETKRYVVVLSFYIKMIKRKTLQVSSSKHSIKKDMFFSLGQIEIILVGQGGVRGWGDPHPLATRLNCTRNLPQFKKFVKDDITNKIEKLA